MFEVNEIAEMTLQGQKVKVLEEEQQQHEPTPSLALPLRGW